MNGCALKLGN